EDSAPDAGRSSLLPPPCPLRRTSRPKRRKMVDRPMSSPTFLVNGWRLGLGALGLVLVFSSSGFAGDGRTGERIYREQCASCHGKRGEGTPDHYPKPLAGDRSVVQLSKLIAKTMPEDDPGTCVGEDADRVASYIYEAFSSPAARERNRPARVQL